MGIPRDISFPTHTVAELLLGLVTMVVPAALGASGMGIVAGVLFGGTLMGLAMSGIGVLDRREDRPAMAVEVHHAADRVVGVGLLISALVLGVSGDVPAGILLALLAAAVSALAFVTRYRATV